MRKALTITLVAALALFAGSAAYANYCARDVVPASTILVPWAVQDMAGTYTPDYSGYTTILNIMNVSSEAQIIHITVWNALSEACLDFNEVLSGYDHWQIFFRDMIAGNFNLFDTSRSSSWDANTGNRYPFEWGPDGRSAYHPQPPTLGSSVGLPLPETTGMVPATDCQMPYNTVPVNGNIDCIRAPLFARSHYGCDVQTGGQNPAGHYNVRSKFINQDWLSKIGTTDRIWFYVTVDVVDRCNFLFPSDTGYFADIQGNPASGFYENANVLIGDIVYLAAASNFSEAINAVHIESDSDEASLFNFYEEKATTTDDPFVFTEPLATALAFEWYNNSLATSSVVMWKNFHEIWPAGGSTSNKVDDCGAYLYYSWDENEHTISRAGGCQVSPCNVNDIDPNEFPFETQMVPIDNTNFDLPDPGGQGYGWMLVIFPPSYGFSSPGGASGDPTYDPSSSGGDNVSARPYMAWAALKINYGSYSAMLDAATMANAHCFPGQVQPQLGIPPLGEAYTYPPTE